MMSKKILRNGKKSKKLSIIVYSCWKNRDMWEIFSILFRKYWPDCPYKVVLVTDAYDSGDHDYVFDLVVLKDDTWGIMIKEAVEAAGTRYVMLWMDDYLLSDRVINDDIEKMIDRISTYHAANLKLIESPVCKCNGAYQQDEKTGWYSRGSAYSFSTQIGIWDSLFLQKVIRDEWSAWEFERIGSLKKGNDRHPIMVALDYTFPYEEGVRQGKWRVEGIRLCRRCGIRIDPSIRPILSSMDMAWIYFLLAILEWKPVLVVKTRNVLHEVKKRLIQM